LRLRERHICRSVASCRHLCTGADKCSSHFDIWTD